MAETLIKMRASVRNRLGVPSSDSFYTDAILTDFINEAVQAYAAEESWPWLQAETTFVTSPVTPTAVTGADFNVPADWTRTKSLDIFGFETMVLMPQQDMTQIVNIGRPLQYCVVNDKIRLRPFPDSVYTIDHEYYKIEPELVNDSDEPLLPNQFRKALVDYATYLAHERSSLEPQRVAEALARYNMWLTRMRQWRRRISAPQKVRVRPGSWL